MADGFNANQFDINRVTPSFDFSGQRTEGDDYIGSLTNFLGGQETLSQASDRISGELGLANLRETGLRLGELGEGLTSQLLALPEGISQRTQNSMVNEGQRQRMLAAESEPLQKNLGELNRALSGVGARLASGEQELGRRLGLQQDEMNRQLLPFEMGFDLLQQRQAREYSGYTFENQLELDRLIANQNAGVTLTEGERNRLNELAVAEKNYQSSLGLLREENKLNNYGGFDLESLWG